MHSPSLLHVLTVHPSPSSHSPSTVHAHAPSPSFQSPAQTPLDVQASPVVQLSPSSQAWAVFGCWMQVPATQAASLRLALRDSAAVEARASR